VILPRDSERKCLEVLLRDVDLAVPELTRELFHGATLFQVYGAERVAERMRRTADIFDPGSVAAPARRPTLPTFAKQHEAVTSTSLFSPLRPALVQVCRISEQCLSSLSAR
jgi:hypothetical protein